MGPEALKGTVEEHRAVIEEAHDVGLTRAFLNSRETLAKFDSIWTHEDDLKLVPELEGLPKPDAVIRDSNGDLTEQRLFIFRVQDGEFKQVAP